MTTFIATLGFDSTRVTRPVLTYGLEEQDEIVLVHPTDHDNPRAEEAKNDVRRMIAELQPNVEIRTVTLDPDGFFDSIRRTAAQIDAAEDDIVLILGGGARDIYLPVAFVTFVRQSSIDSVLQFSDISGSVSELEIPNFLHPPGKSVVETLEVIVNEEHEGASLELIANVLNVAKSTVARHVTELEERDFVRSEREGKSKIAYPTEQGCLAVDLGAV
jgi:CRISPR-associated protein Csa3